MDEKKCLLLLTQDDKEAFALIYKKYWRQVYNFACLYISSKEDVEEIAQEVFVKLWDVRHFIRAEENFKGFLFIITRNIIFNQNRKKVNESFYKMSVLSALERDSYDLEAEIEAHDLSQYIDMLIEDMPPKRREVFNLSRKENMTYAEIAEKLDISVKTVERQINEALKYLKKNVVLLTFFLR